MNWRESRIRGSGERGIYQLKVLQRRQVSGHNKAQGLAMSVTSSVGHGVKEADSVRDGTLWYRASLSTRTAMTEILCSYSALEIFQV